MRKQEQMRARKPRIPLFDWRTFEPSMVRTGNGRPSLVEELTTYRDRLSELLKHKGDYVVIKGKNLKVLPDRDTAVSYALERYGAEPALVKEIVAKEPYVYLNGPNL